MFTERGFVTRVLMASFDLCRLQQLDDQLTQVLGDMQVGLLRVKMLCIAGVTGPLVVEAYSLLMPYMVLGFRSQECT